MDMAGTTCVLYFVLMKPAGKHIRTQTTLTGVHKHTHTHICVSVCLGAVVRCAAVVSTWPPAYDQRLQPLHEG